MTALRRTIAVMILCALTVALTPALAERADVAVKRGSAAVYNAAGDVVGTLPANTRLTLTGRRGKVCRVCYKGKTGYMKKSDLVKLDAAVQPDAAAQSVSMTAYAARKGAKVYSARRRVIAKLSLNAEVTVTGVKGKYCRVTSNGKTGYMKKSDLSATRASERETKTRTAYVSRDGAKVYGPNGKVMGTLPLDTAVTVEAVKGDVCKITANGKTGFMRAEDLASKPTKTPVEKQEDPSVSTAKPAKGKAKEMDWWNSGIQKKFPRGATATVTDVDTGLAWNEQRRGGTNHADVQPVTAADTAALKQAYGGAWSWTRRAIFVTIDGENYAASMNGMPHGGGNITDNDFNGHHCIHFTNSRTHGSNRVCALHQAAIKKAAETTLN